MPFFFVQVTCEKNSLRNSENVIKAHIPAILWSRNKTNVGGWKQLVNYNKLRHEQRVPACESFVLDHAKGQNKTPQMLPSTLVLFLNLYLKPFTANLNRKCPGQSVQLRSLEWAFHC